MAALESRSQMKSLSGQPGLCRSADDLELLDKLTAFTAAANRGEVIKALDAANLAFAHGMFKCGTQRTSVSNRAGVLSQCARRFLCVSSLAPLLAQRLSFDHNPDNINCDLLNSKISKDPHHLLMFVFNCGNYTQKHLRDAATAESKRTLSASKSFTRVPIPFCNERGLRKKLSCALYWHQDLIRAMLLEAREKPVLAPLVRSHVRGVRYGISRQVQHYLEKLSELCSKSTSPTTGLQPLTIDGLYKWSQTYCKVWMVGFEEVETEYADILDPALCAASSWVATASPVDTMHMHQLESVEATIAKQKVAETGADAVRTGMASKQVSGAVCGLFMMSALKSHEENARLNSIVAAMRSDFGTQLKMTTLSHTNSALADANNKTPGKSNKRAKGDSGTASSNLQTCAAADGDSNSAAAVAAAELLSPQQSRHRRQQTQTRRTSKPRKQVADKADAEDKGVLDDSQSVDLGGSAQQALWSDSRDTGNKTPSDVSTDSVMGGEVAQQLQQLGGTDSLLDAELPMLHHPTDSMLHPSDISTAPGLKAVDPFAASEALSAMHVSAQLASRFDSGATSVMHDSAFTSGPGPWTPAGEAPSSGLMHSQSAVSASAALSHVQIPQGVESPNQALLSRARTSLPSMHIQQQQQQGVAWNSQQLQQHMLLQQQHSSLQIGSQCLTPWDQSSFMGASSFMGGTSSFMSPRNALEGHATWAISPQSHAPTQHGAPQVQHAPHMYTNLHRRTCSSTDHHQQSMLMSPMPDVAPYAAPHTGADKGYTCTQEMPYHPMPVQQLPQQPLPAQPGNPFASAMASSQSLAHMRSTSFAT